MGKRSIKSRRSFLCAVVGLFSGLHSVLYFTNYATKERGYEADLLRASSAYVQQYEEKNPKEPLEYLLRTMDIVKQNNAFQESVSKLEKEVQEVITQISESKSPMVYKPVLKNITKKVDAILRDKAAKPDSLAWGIGLLCLALTYFGITVNYLTRGN